MAMRFLALVLKKFSVLMCWRRPSSPRSSIFWGVLATANRFFVALLTPTSVAWAESATATSSV
jgi:hypothetical protein